MKAALKAQKILQEISQAIQQQTHKQISRVVSKCLTTIFGEDAYEFKIEFDQKRGKTNARLVLLKDGEEFSPKDEVGVGVLDVVSFALRLSAILLTRPPVRKIMILDEPFKNLRGKQYRKKVRDLIVQLSEELGVQFIINIDIDSYPEFELGKVIQIGESSG